MQTVRPHILTFHMYCSVFSDGAPGDSLEERLDALECFYDEEHFWLESHMDTLAAKVEPFGLVMIWRLSNSVSYCS